MESTSPPSPASDQSAPPSPEAGAARSFSLAQLVGILFLLGQVAFVLQARLADDTPRLLTPVEGLTHYEINAAFEKQTYDAPQIRERYGIAPSGSLALTAAAVQELIAYRERPIPLAHATYVRLRIQQAGGADQYWLWPQE
jgi:hypothetical protein